MQAPTQALTSQELDEVLGIFDSAVRAYEEALIELKSLDMEYTDILEKLDAKLGAIEASLTPKPAAA